MSPPLPHVLKASKMIGTSSVWLPLACTVHCKRPLGRWNCSMLADATAQDKAKATSDGELSLILSWTARWGDDGRSKTASFYAAMPATLQDPRGRQAGVEATLRNLRKLDWRHNVDHGEFTSIVLIQLWSSVQLLPNGSGIIWGKPTVWRHNIPRQRCRSTESCQLAWSVLPLVREPERRTTDHSMHVSSLLRPANIPGIHSRLPKISLSTTQYLSSKSPASCT